MGAFNGARQPMSCLLPHSTFDGNLARSWASIKTGFVLCLSNITWHDRVEAAQEVRYSLVWEVVEDRACDAFQKGHPRDGDDTL
jgi:hypothetical protein